MKFKEMMKQLKIDLEPMTFGEKVEHIWINFKEYIIVFGLLALGLIGYVVMLLMAKDPALTIYTVNVDLNEAGNSYVCEDFLSTIGDPRKEKIMAVYREYVEDPSGLQIEDNSTVMSQIAAMVEAKALDVVISDKVGMEVCLSLDIYLDLREILTAEELASMEGKIVYGIPEDSDLLHPFALDITDTAFAKDHLNAKDTVFIGFVANSQQLENCRSWWELIQNYETKPGGQ